MSLSLDIQQAEAALLAESDISIDTIQRQLSTAMVGIDWADVYLQKHRIESWNLEEGIVKSGSFSIDQGIGLRAVKGDTTAYASSDMINKKSLDLLKTVASTTKKHGENITAAPVSTYTTPIPRFEKLISTTDDVEKIAILKKIDAICRRNDSVENVIASVVNAYDTVLIVRPDEGVAVDFRPMIRISVQVIVHEGSTREVGGTGWGGRFDFIQLTDAILDSLCTKAIKDAIEKLHADETPAGSMPVVLGNGWAGVLLHEAIGHGLEGDFNRKQLSAFSGRVGQKVAADDVTVIDAGNIDNRRGSLSCDDEGTQTQSTTLIENGVLCGYMQDVTNARLMNVAPTGNGRRESYAYPPMPRMTNTFMTNGPHTPEAIIGSVKKGIYAADFNGGEVDITNGNFVFVASKARLIENGKLGKAVKGATIIGNGPSIMPAISMVGNDFSLDPGVGTCGKDGQWVPVGVGQPTIKIDSITVGGTQS